MNIDIFNYHSRKEFQAAVKAVMKMACVRFQSMINTLEKALFAICYFDLFGFYNTFNYKKLIFIIICGDP